MMGAVILVPVICAVAGLWLLPVFVAAHRHHPNRTAILVTDLLFGWTVLGWGIALIWAVSGPSYRVEAPRELDWATQQRRAMLVRDRVR